MEHKPWYRSKKWWTSVVAAVVPLLNSRFGWGLEAQELAAIVLPLIAYTLGEAWTDAAHKEDLLILEECEEDTE